MSNWADHLPGDLLNLILSNLFGKDRLSFSGVCRHWNAVAAASPYRYSPCLMRYYRRNRTWKFYQYNTFLDMSFPELENAKIRYSKYGWLLMSRDDDGIIFFFDPSNNQKVVLPPCTAVHHRCTLLCFFNPPTSPECVLVRISIIHVGHVIISTLKSGEDEWESMENPITNKSNTFWLTAGAPVLHCGVIYFLGMRGDVAILDIKQRRWDVNFNCLGLEYSGLDIKENYLVKVNGEQGLFGVFVFDNERKVNVFRLSSADMKWDLVEGIGDKVMYLSHTNSFGYKAPTKSMENTIYFPKFHGDVAVFYSLSDAKYHSLDGDYLEDNAYGLKAWDFATWVMPTPALNVITTISWL